MEFAFAGLVILLFYFILLRPILNQQKARRQEISELQIGDEVLTTGGFFATVRELDRTVDGEPLIVLEAAPGVLLQGTPLAIDRIVRSALHDGDDQEDPDDRDDWDDWDEDDTERATAGGAVDADEERS